MVTIYVHIEALERFVRKADSLHTTDVFDVEFSLRPKNRHIQISIDYDDFINILNKSTQKF